MTTLTGRWQHRRRTRHLDGRAGQFSNRLASERFDSFVKANIRKLVVLAMGALAVSMALWFGLASFGDMRGLIVGAFSAAIATSLYHWCVLASGAVGAMMGATAETWTSTELKRLRGKGWRTVDHVIFRGGDIDHIAVGPDGVMVVETKWRSEDTNVDDDRWLQSAVRQVLANKKDVAGHLGWGARRDAPITSVVVVWGPRITQSDPGALVTTAEGVNIVPGSQLRDELARLSDSVLSDEEIDAIHRKLTRWVEQKDRWTAERSEPLPPTLAEQAQAWFNRSGAFLAGSLAATVALRLGTWYFAVAAVLVLVGICGRRSERLRPFVVPWIVGSQWVTVLVLAVVLANLA